ncbi:tRNA uridine-5-carboxymethylaminomethyl(34) synthesis GTPase MnmE [bacterium]|nr:tRNA uridine-5-carboxymethylaminomethyl(34) synthesis GTPase MnmE [bacterium]
MTSLKSLDMIFAQSSAKGRAALAVHRISGPGCLKPIEHLLRRAKTDSEGTLVPGQVIQLSPGMSRYCFLVDANERIVDDCMVVHFFGPNSYTGEDTLEITCHGNPFISARLHSLLRQLGYRDAEPGEFTQRAFLNGKLDLTRAEAIDQLIHADTISGVELARQASVGTIGSHSRRIRERLVGAMAYFEAHIDFAEDEVGSYDATIQAQEIASLRDEIRSLAATYSTGLKMREGLQLILLGEPNAGKSSLYNCLLGRERAIVTDIPGTTRDLVEDRLVLNGRDFVILDTAGLRHTSDVVESIGVSRALGSAKKADIICWILDPTRIQLDTFLEKIKTDFVSFKNSIEPTLDASFLVIFTKEDFWSEELRKKIENIPVDFFAERSRWTHCSAQKNDIELLKNEIESLYDAKLNFGTKGEIPILISERQRDKALLACGSLNQALELISQKDFPEKIASLLLQAAQHIADLIGEIGTDDVLENIFSNFCIGK